MPLTICMALVQRRLPGKCTAQVFGFPGVLSCWIIAWFPPWQTPATPVQIRIGGISVRPCEHAYGTDAAAVGDPPKRKARTPQRQSACGACFSPAHIRVILARARA